MVTICQTPVCAPRKSSLGLKHPPISHLTRLDRLDDLLATRSRERHPLDPRPEILRDGKFEHLDCFAAASDMCGAEGAPVGEEVGGVNGW